MSTEVQNTTSSQHDAKLPLCEGLNNSAQIIFQNNKAKGFWDNERNVGELLMLVTSELGEAMEAHRKGRFAEFEKAETNVRLGGEWDANFKAHIKDTFEDEIADTMIRLFDLCGGFNIDIAAHLYYKLEYNKTRERLHGKKY